jgi:integrase
LKKDIQPHKGVSRQSVRILTNCYTLGDEMLVHEYLDQVIKSRPYKYSTKQTLIKDVKRMGVWEMDTSEITSALIRDKVDSETNHNSRRRLYITARSIFKDLGVCQDLPKLESISRIYDFPSQEDLHELIDQSKYRLQLFLCMYAGLRVGEACAVTPEKLSGDYLEVNEAYSQDGLHLGSPKTYGKVLLPHWLAEEIQKMKPEQYWKLGMTTKMVSNSIYKLSRNKKWSTRTGGRGVNPHMLRHFYATEMIRRGVNPEIVRRQMRHKNVSTTLRIYTQVQSEELIDSLPQRPTSYKTGPADTKISNGNVIHYEFGAIG